MLSPLDALYLLICVVAGVEWHWFRSRGGLVGKSVRKAVADAKMAVLPSEKAEYLPPMNDEDYEKWQLDLSGKSELQEKLDENAPWKSPRPNSQ